MFAVPTLKSSPDCNSYNSWQYKDCPCMLRESLYGTPSKKKIKRIKGHCPKRWEGVWTRSQNLLYVKLGHEGVGSQTPICPNFKTDLKTKVLIGRLSHALLNQIFCQYVTNFIGGRGSEVQLKCPNCRCPKVLKYGFFMASLCYF